FLGDAGLEVRAVKKVQEGRPHCVDLMESGGIRLVINTTEGRQAIADSHSLRRAALLSRIAYFTTMRAARAAVDAIAAHAADGLRVAPLQSYHRAGLDEPGLEQGRECWLRNIR